MAFEVVKSAWTVFQKGKQVANPEVWKVYSVSIQMLLALLTAIVGLLRANGYDLPVTDETLMYLATCIVAGVYGVRGVCNVITSPDKGVRPRGISSGCTNNEGDG